MTPAERTRAKVLVSGFGPFLHVVDNPSSRLAFMLAARPGSGWEARALELPTSFLRAPRLSSAAAEAGFDFLLALGVGRSGLRLERLARGVVTSEHPDVDGETWTGERLGPDRVNPLPLEAWAAQIGGEPRFEVSEDCGGYVCNAMNHHVLSAWPGRGLFVHVPPDSTSAESLSAVADQLAALLDLVVVHLDKGL